uniref:Potassium channel domain-containing protein n=1 Tax=Plectus sambesii TaxID=2011161 RepID=A0A914V0A4_9BILA
MPSVRIQRCNRCVNKYHVRPLFLLLVSVVYLGMGGAGFLFFEQSHHLRVSDNWHHQMRLERREFARFIARRIFNDTTQLMIVIDQDQTAKVTERLYGALKLYERKKLKHVSPYTVDWSLPNSVGYSLGLLTTVGQAGRTPATYGGQVFALCYSLLGIPFFFGTIATIAYDILLPLLIGKVSIFTSRPALDKFVKVSLVTIAFFVWFLAISTVFYFFSSPFNDQPWEAVYTVGMALLTVQIADWQVMEPWALWALHVCVALSLLLFALIVLLLAKWSRPQFAHSVRHDVVQDASTSAVEAQKKFSVTVDKNGSSKLLPAPLAPTAESVAAARQSFN